MRYLTGFGLAVVFLGQVAGYAHAQNEPKLIGSFREWEAYTYGEPGKPVCYMLARPKSTTALRDGKKVAVERGDTYILVTHQPARKSRDVVSVTVGYPFKTGSTVTVKIDKNGFALYTADDKAVEAGADGQTAWARDDDDPKLVAAMKAGTRMEVIGISDRGTETRDSYSLLGFTAAHSSIDKACK